MRVGRGQPQPQARVVAAKFAGGFEVHLSEGYAHVDIVTAEDDADNNVTGPLLDFLARNLE